MAACGMKFVEEDLPRKVKRIEPARRMFDLCVKLM